MRIMIKYKNGHMNELLLLKQKDGSGYTYINLTKGHICPCRFKDIPSALADLRNYSSIKAFWGADCDIHKWLYAVSTWTGGTIFVNCCKEAKELQKEMRKYYYRRYGNFWEPVIRGVNKWERM